MTPEEIQQIAARVAEVLAASSQGVGEVPVVDSVAGIVSLPAIKQVGSIETVVSAPIALLKGKDGREVSFRLTETAIQWQYTGGQWTDLITREVLLLPAQEVVAQLTAALNAATAKLNDINVEWGTIKPQMNEAITAESGRVNAEKNRVTAETSRVNTEKNRVTAETGRVDAEKNRVAAESKRQTDTTEALTQSAAATKKATDAATEWSEMKPNIETLVTETEAAKDSATTAATTATTQADYAKEQGNAAKTAAQEANAAKEGVEEAIEKAEAVSEHPPIIGDDLYWYYWDADAQVYVKTEHESKGDPGAGNVDIVNTSSVVKDVPYVLSPTANGAQTYNAVEAVVGGRNYISASLIGSHTPYNTKPIVSNGGRTIRTTYVGSARYWTLSAGFGTSINNKEFTVTGYIKINGEIPPLSVFGAGLANNSGASASDLKRFSYDETTGLFIITQIFRSAWVIHRACPGIQENDVIELTDLQLLKGTIPSDWSPAPEDKQDRIDIPNWRLPYKANGVWEGRILDVAPNSNTVPIRTDGGRVKVSDAVEANDAVNLGQLMAQFRETTEYIPYPNKLPAVGDGKYLYIVQAAEGSTTSNLFRWIEKGGVWQWQELGSTAIDMSNYAKIADLNNKNDLHAIYGASNVDLDTVISPNKLVVKNYALAATNKPAGSNNANGLLSIAIHPESGASKYYKQVAFSSNRNIYHRIIIGTSWTPWVKLVNESDLTALAKKSKTKSATLTVANWVDDTANSGFWKYTVNDAEIAATSTVVHVPASTADKAKGKDAGLDEYAEATAGKLVIFSESKPGENININYVIQD